jgi:cyclophilin family peptidyl-prolyl cis-trans isomerase
MRTMWAIACGAMGVLVAAAGAGAAEGGNPVVLMKTSMGDVKIELDKGKAPVTVENFLVYVNDKFYDGTIFHRVIPAFMIQGGGFDKDMNQKKTKAPIKNEAGNGLKNLNGTIAMARTGDPNSATAQFFINTKDNPFLDHKNDTPQGMGYAVFGKVVDGADVVKKIEQVQTTTRSPYENVPVTPVIIESIRVVQ